MPAVISVSHNRPPLRFDRTFLQEKYNQLKLIQIALGLFALILTANCWPNPYTTYCTNKLFSFFQLFNAVCVTGFFLVGTSLFTLASLFSVQDAFYQYNFQLLEKFYVTLALGMYLLAVSVSVINLTKASFTLLWLFQVAVTIAAFFAYFFDFWIRWKNDKNQSNI